MINNQSLFWSIFGYNKMICSSDSFKFMKGKMKKEISVSHIPYLKYSKGKFMIPQNRRSKPGIVNFKFKTIHFNVGKNEEDVMKNIASKTMTNVYLSNTTFVITKYKWEEIGEMISIDEAYWEMICNAGWSSGGYLGPH